MVNACAKAVPLATVVIARVIRLRGTRPEQRRQNEAWLKFIDQQSPRGLAQPFSGGPTAEAGGSQDRLRELRGDALGGVAVPEFRYAAPLAAGGEDVADAGQDQRAVAADQRVGALLDGDRALGIGAQRETGHAETRGLLLHAAGIGEHEARLAHQPEG